MPSLNDIILPPARLSINPLQKLKKFPEGRDPRANHRRDFGCTGASTADRGPYSMHRPRMVTMATPPSATAAGMVPKSAALAIDLGGADCSLASRPDPGASRHACLQRHLSLTNDDGGADDSVFPDPPRRQVRRGSSIGAVTPSLLAASTIPRSYAARRLFRRVKRIRPGDSDSLAEKATVLVVK